MATRVRPDSFAAPAEPPQFLSREEITELCWNGWLKVNLPGDLATNISKLQTAATSWFGQTESAKLSDFGGRNMGEEGYYEIAGEKQYVTFRRSINPRLYLELLARHVWAEIAALLHRVLCDLSRAGELPLNAWEPVIKSALALPASNANLLENTTLLRLFKYEPEMGISDKHSDLGLLTMCVGQGAGLEVLDRRSLSMAWEPAPKCTLLIGESLRVLSSNHIRTGVHRVVANPQGRQSLVFALRPDLTKTVDLRDFGGRGQLNLRTMFNNIKNSKYNVNEKKEIREQQIKDQAAAARSTEAPAIKQDPEQRAVVSEVQASMKQDPNGARVKIKQEVNG